jgi:hypothetical protein
MHPNFFILEGCWDGLDIKYVHSENPIEEALVMYVANTETLEADWLNYIPKKLLVNYLLISFTPFSLTRFFDQEVSVSLSPFIYQIEITNPSILHLAQLLQTEMEAPKIFSQEFVFAIVTTMIRYCEAQKSVEVGIIDANGVM